MGLWAGSFPPCLYTCPFSSCKPSFIQHPARHCSLDQCRHPDRLMESNTYTDRLMHPPNTGSLATSNLFFCPTFHSFMSQSIQLSLNPLDVRFSLGWVPVFALKTTQSTYNSVKKLPLPLCSGSYLLLRCSLSCGEHFQRLALHVASGISFCGGGLRVGEFTL